MPRARGKAVNTMGRITPREFFTRSLRVPPWSPLACTILQNFVHYLSEPANGRARP